ncbi:MAG: chemotaxis protein CheA, partial [Thermoleophilia bacterium]|nr:chemotaxis protein CheA [Thermoleophilia bacterium]
MDMGQYMGVFVAECRELIESLNLSIVELERATDAPGTIDEIFRVAHSFKGISSTMGFDRMAGLTHEMEHLLDIVRSGGRAVDEELITVLLGCLDMLEQAVDSIEVDGDEGIDPTALVAQLQVLSHDEGAVAAVAAPAAAATATLPDPGGFPSGVALLHVHVEIDPACDSASIRAYMAYGAAEAVAEPMWSEPSPEDLDTWEEPRLDLLVLDEGPELVAELEAALARIPELSVVSVARWVPDAEPVAPAVVAPAPVAPVLLDAELAPTARIDDTAASADAAPDVAVAGGSQMRQRKSGTVRVDAERLDSLMHLMGEVVIHRSMLEVLIRDRDLDGAAAAVQELRRSTQALQTEVMNVRMVPVETALMRMPRLVRDLATKLGKEVELVISGADTEIDRSVVDALGEPLVHLVRNGLDHGIEPPDEREASGKPRTATLAIGAQHAGGNVLITVADDGRGVDPDRVKARAIERGIITRDEAALLDEAGAVELLFRPGFSTA